jgi:hypothetical protein
MGFPAHDVHEESRFDIHALESVCLAQIAQYDRSGSISAH